MSFAFNAIILLIAAGPVFAAANAPVAGAFQMLIAAFALMACAISARKVDTEQFFLATSNLLWLFLLIPIWIFVQLLPLPLLLSHPIWTSANEALRANSAGHISVDISETIWSFFSVLTMLALVCITIVIGRDRKRAELILLMGSAITTLLALTTLIQFVLARSAAFISVSVSINLVSFGIILNVATVLLAIERRETRRDATAPFLAIGIGGVVGVLICVVALAEIGSLASRLSVMLGVAFVLIIVMVRRLDFGKWPVAALFIATGAGAAIMVTWLYEQGQPGPVLQRFLPAATASTALSGILGDIRWAGTGAGTFDVIARIYQGSEVIPIAAPSTAIALAVELGWIGLAIAVLSGFILTAKLFRSALQRGRDSFFPAAAGACVTFGLCNAFVTSGLLEPGAAALSAIIVGLGLSQGFSQSSRQ